MISYNGPAASSELLDEGFAMVGARLRVFGEADGSCHA